MSKELENEIRKIIQDSQLYLDLVVKDPMNSETVDNLIDLSEEIATHIKKEYVAKGEPSENAKEYMYRKFNEQYKKEGFIPLADAAKHCEIDEGKVLSMLEEKDSGTKDYHGIIENYEQGYNQGQTDLVKAIKEAKGLIVKKGK